VTGCPPWFNGLEVGTAEEFATHRQAKTEIFDHIEAFYNQNRIHTSLHGLSPASFELKNNEPKIPILLSIFSKQAHSPHQAAQIGRLMRANFVYLAKASSASSTHRRPSDSSFAASFNQFTVREFGHALGVGRMVCSGSGASTPAIQPGTLKQRVDRLQAKLNPLFNAMPGRGRSFGLPPIQREPRPLIHFVPKE